jgi:hypothetical protein
MVWRWQRTAHRKRSARWNWPKLLRGEQPRLDQLRRRLQPIGIFADPEERVEVAQAALAFLDVGLDHIAAVAHAPVPLVALLQLLGDEAAHVAARHLAPEARHQLVEQGWSPHT